MIKNTNIKKYYIDESYRSNINNMNNIDNYNTSDFYSDSYENNNNSDNDCDNDSGNKNTKFKTMINDDDYDISD